MVLFSLIVFLVFPVLGYLITVIGSTVRRRSKRMLEKLEGLVTKLKADAKIEYTKEGEVLKPVPRPEGGFPMMPPAKKSQDDKDAAKDKAPEKADDKSGK